jgi:hypothetical protein
VYNKLFSKIVDSSIWMEPDHVRLIWMMFIAIMDEDGFVNLASVKNVAHRAVMDLDKAEDAINVLESSDKDSSNPDNEGRRLTRVPGGWVVNNAKEYRDIVKREHQKELNRERVRRHRKQIDVMECNGGVMDANENVMPSDTDTGAEAYSEADTNAEAVIQVRPVQEPAPTQEGASTDLGTCEAVPELLQEITSYWNSRMNQQCRITAKRKRAFSARSKDKWFVENWRAAIDAAANSGFCCGDTGWTADLEWFLKPDSAEKLVEGKYAKTRSVVTQAQQREINSRSAREQWVEEMKSKGPDNWLPAGFIKGEMTFDSFAPPKDVLKKSGDSS